MEPVVYRSNAARSEPVGEGAGEPPGAGGDLLLHRAGAGEAYPDRSERALVPSGGDSGATGCAPCASGPGKWELLAEVAAGKRSVASVREHQGLSREQMEEWLRGFHRLALTAFDEELRSALVRQGAEPEALSGPELTLSLSKISIVNWIQALQLFAEHAVITVVEGGTRSRLWCSRGSLIDAESGLLRGEAAVYRIVSLERGQALTELREVQRERTIRASTSALLLEAARRKDEAALLRLRLGDLERRFERAPLEDVHPAVSPAEAAALSLFEQPCRLCDAIARSRLGDLETLHTIESLIRMKQLVEARTPPGPVPSPLNQGPQETSRPGSEVFPISWVWGGREPRRGGARWLASTLITALTVAMAAWLGATLPRSQASPEPLPPLPSSAPALVAPAQQGGTYAVKLRPHPPEAQMELDGRAIGSGFWSTRLPRDGTLHELRVTLEGYVPLRILFIDTPPPLDVRLDPLPPADEEEVEEMAPREERTRPGYRRRAASERATQGTPSTRARRRRPYVQIIEEKAADPAAHQSDAQQPEN